MNDSVNPEALAQSKKVGGKYQPLPQLSKISRGRYTDEAFYRAEIEYMFRRTWLQVAHISEFEKAGSYQAFELFETPLLIVRGKDNELRAFVNSCQHRGAEVKEQGEGCARTLTCQFHGWSYDFTGRLIGIPSKESFPGLDPETHSLKSVRCELWGGFVFVNLDKNAPPLADKFEPLMKRYSTATEAPLRVVAKNSWELDCNWKMMVEVGRETYHVNTIHRNTVAKAMDAPSTHFELYPNGHSTIFMPLPQEVSSQSWEGITRAASTLKPIPNFDRVQTTQNLQAATCFPSQNFAFQPMGFPVMSVWPLAKGRCRFDAVWYGTDWGSGQVPEEWSKIVADFAYLVEEDIEAIASLQKTLEGATEGDLVLGTPECQLYHLHAEIDKAIGAENIPAGLRVSDLDVLANFITP